MKKFEPTAAHLESCENYVVALAAYNVIKKTDFEIRKQILESQQYRPNATLQAVKPEFKSMSITDPDMDYLIAGFETPEVSGDAAQYIAEVNRRTRNAGLIYAENAECRADNHVLKTGNQLIHATKDIHGIDVDDANASLETRKTLLDLTMRLLVPFLNRERMDTKLKALYKDNVEIPSKILTPMP